MGASCPGQNTKGVRKEENACIKRLIRNHIETIWSIGFWGIWGQNLKDRRDDEDNYWSICGSVKTYSGFECWWRSALSKDKGYWEVNRMIFKDRE